MKVKIEEEFLHYIWRIKNFDLTNLVSSTGQRIEITSFGHLNFDAGPDFLHARVKIDNQLWVGQVEMHVMASDWFSHNHSSDEKYHNVILHVVYEEDVPVYRLDGTRIPCLVLRDRISPHSLERYRFLKISRTWIPCQQLIHRVPANIRALAKQQLLAYRLEDKAREILLELGESDHNFTQLIYQKLGWAFGLRVNTYGFEQLTQRVPYSIIKKHRNSLLQVESMLFGVSGMIPKSTQSKYTKSLKNEFLMLKRKFDLNPMMSSVWNYSKMRPAAFPNLRIAQFSMLLHSLNRLEDILFENTTKGLNNLLDIDTSDYWKTHYRFDVPSSFSTKRLGAEKRNAIIINVVSPLLFAYGIWKKTTTYKNKALSLLEELPSENNALIKKWSKIGIKSHTAGESQALINLKKNYCDNFKCLNCPIGHNLITKQPCKSF